MSKVDPLLIIEVENTNGSGNKCSCSGKNELFTFKSSSLSMYLKARKYTGSSSQRVRLQLPHYRPPKKLREGDVFSRAYLSVRLPVRRVWGGEGAGEVPIWPLPGPVQTCSLANNNAPPPPRTTPPSYNCTWSSPGLVQTYLVGPHQTGRPPP